MRVQPIRIPKMPARDIALSQVKIGPFPRNRIKILDNHSDLAPQLTPKKTHHGEAEEGAYLTGAGFPRDPNLKVRASASNSSNKSSASWAASFSFASQSRMARSFNCFSSASSITDRTAERMLLSFCSSLLTPHDSPNPSMRRDAHLSKRSDSRGAITTSAMTKDHCSLVQKKWVDY
ncbi:hypothetical protein QJS10_CPA16g01040 [Acorus calamus]|uniref:Uncharacterized protein n=1 Tax=Acorus calamus TaxID=4465 RepID=A0AAV9D451_ACOCL|nr:hypothetical protein QJS10_CPA16g01040 [Acorus calamus]